MIKFWADFIVSRSTVNPFHVINFDFVSKKYILVPIFQMKNKEWEYNFLKLWGPLIFEIHNFVN